MKTTIVQFLLEKDSENEVFAYFPFDFDYTDKNITGCYSHVGQHSGCHKDYAKECKEADYYQYKDLLKELFAIGYKNLEILNTQDVELHRKPTTGEIRFGEGATHYRTFNITDVMDKKGNLKSRIKANDDGLIYSR